MFESGPVLKTIDTREELLCVGESQYVERVLLVARKKHQSVAHEVTDLLGVDGAVEYLVETCDRARVGRVVRRDQIFGEVKVLVEITHLDWQL